MCGRMGGDTAKTRGASQPKGYSRPYYIKWGEEEGGDLWSDGVGLVSGWG